MERFRQRFRSDEGGLDIGQVLQSTLGVGAALLLFSLILVTCVDVVGRYFFSAPLSGAFEITEILLAALVLRRCRSPQNVRNTSKLTCSMLS